MLKRSAFWWRSEPKRSHIEAVSRTNWNSFVLVFQCVNCACVLATIRCSLLCEIHTYTHIHVRPSVHELHTLFRSYFRFGSVRCKLRIKLIILNISVDIKTQHRLSKRMNQWMNEQSKAESETLSFAHEKSWKLNKRFEFFVASISKTLCNLSCVFFCCFSWLRIASEKKIWSDRKSN